MDAPVLGAQSDYDGPDKWLVSFTWRWQRSSRHFRGKEEEAHRKDENTEVINRLHQAELGVRYNIDKRWSVAMAIPYLMATRSYALRNEDDVVFDRAIVQARGMGDVTVVGRCQLLDPEKSPHRNFVLGLGVKLPTGDNNVVDARRRYDDETGEYTSSVETVDQSIQPGDGGFGFVVDFQGIQRFADDRALAYVTASYLVNPEEKSGVLTYRRRESEAIMSIADQYLARLGVTWYPGAGFGVSLGGRLEGIPVEDLVGGSEGFRRPGYALSVEPGLSWTKGPHTISLAVPIAVERNRQRSVPDMMEAGRHGDAAFADYVVLAGYFRRF